MNYWDSVSTLAGEVENPGKTFPRALAGAVAVVVAGYLFPLVVGLSYSAKAKDWDLGYFAVVGDQVLGWLSQGVVGKRMRLRNAGENILVGEQIPRILFVSL